jgi:alanyl-tRNA synthetase
MDASELRRAWYGFFEAKAHARVPSDSLIPTHPTAPMFTNSGMMPFVPYFLGEEQPPYRRAVSIQKCVRAGGKHNDLDAIGRSPRHMSFFEMLGNFSFGDYFQTEAIAWAWELLVDVLGLDPERLWVTVHVSDDEAERIWRDEVGVPAERIQRLDKDNFWEMGDVGPCGPSSEIFYDYGPTYGPDGGPANPAAEERYVEIWNLVFTRYFRQPGGELTDLAQRNIDTGAGLERMLGAVNGTHSVYDTDVLTALVDTAQRVTGHRLGDGGAGVGAPASELERGDVAVRLLADHARTMTFLVADGVVPSNEDRGYVLRRIIRRAVRYGHLLGVEEALTPPLVDTVVAKMGDDYPELIEGHDRIRSLVGREEERFRRTLARGATVLDARLAALGDGATLAGGTLSGDAAFDLYETYGFPVEVTEEVATEVGVAVDRAGYDAALVRAQVQSKRGARQGADYANLTTFTDVLDRHGPSDFVGREEFDTKATVLAVVPGPTDGPLADTVSVFLDRTPFYAESGGQVGDTGTIETDTGRADVLDTTYGLPGLHRHVARLVEGTVEPGQGARAAIDVGRRDAIRRNHTGTHVLHWALRQVLGEDVQQQGSYVDAERMRFDFGPADGLTPDQIRRIEDLANGDVLANPPVHHFETTKAHAAELGAIAFFGDKYGEIVRVLEAGPHSTELCGGTHVKALGDIGPIKIVSEGSIGSNLRRIEAVTGFGPIDRLRQAEDRLATLAGVLNTSVGEVVDTAHRRADETKALRTRVRELERRLATGQAAGLAAGAVDGIVVTRVEGLDRDGVRDLAVAVRAQPGIRAVVLGAAPEGGGATLVAAVAPGSGLHAGELIAEAAKAIRGGGGKAPDLAVAGGKDPAGVDAALAIARSAADA